MRFHRREGRKADRHAGRQRACANLEAAAGWNADQGAGVRLAVAARPLARARVGYKAPEEIVVLDAMPLNATGKVDRVTLKRMAEKRLTSVGPS
jgi:acyl-CoA synthetase (AMP-forming)/AMP-acid ligase II